jgi:heme exporter protein CcmD
MFDPLAPHAFYVIAAYSVAAVIFVVLAVHTYLSLRKMKKDDR